MLACIIGDMWEHRRMTTAFLLNRTLSRRRAANPGPPESLGIPFLVNFFLAGVRFWTLVALHPCLVVPQGTAANLKSPERSQFLLILRLALKLYKYTV